MSSPRSPKIAPSTAPTPSRAPSGSSRFRRVPIRRPTSRSTTIAANSPSAISNTDVVKIMGVLSGLLRPHGLESSLALGRHESVHCVAWQRDETKGGSRLGQDLRPVNANADIVLAPDQP